MCLAGLVAIALPTKFTFHGSTSDEWRPGLAALLEAAKAELAEATHIRLMKAQRLAGSLWA